MARLTYLHIRGTLEENMVYTARPGFESTHPGRRNEGDQNFQLVLLDETGRALVSVNPEVNPRACGQVGDPLRFRVRGVLALHPGGVAYELRRGEISLVKASIPAERPDAAAVTAERGELGLELSWQANERTDLTYDVKVVMESGRRLTIARGLSKTSYKVELDRLPVAGRGQLFVVVNDGVRSSEVDAGEIDVPRRPPTLHIISPSADSLLPYGQPVSVLGACLDMEGRPCATESVIWSLDGERFAAGSLIASLNHPTPGSHRLTLTYGLQEAQVETSIRVDIEEPDEEYREWERLIAESAQLTHR